jgi:cell division protease FtsH
MFRRSVLLLSALVALLGSAATQVRAAEQKAGCTATFEEQAAEIRDTPPAGSFGTIMRDEAVWRRLGPEYLACEIEAGNVRKLLFLENSTAAAELSDGRRLEVKIPEGRIGWFAATAAQAGVELETTDRPEIPEPVPADRADGTSLLGRLVLVASFSFLLVLFIVWRRRSGKTRTLVRVSGSGSKNPKGGSDVPETRFKDVAGCREAVEDLQELVDVLKHPERFTTVGARPPKGALLVGPPGTGKTLLARAVAGEAGVPFFAAAGSDFVEMYVGVGARRVRDIFEKARKAGRAIVFIDEVDAVGRRRSESVTTGGDQEHENTLISLLNELDGFTNSQVVLIAATNRPDVLDPALTRPGRLDRRVHVGLPDPREREEILSVHTRSKPLAEDVSLTALARRTPGMSGAQLEQVCNEAALVAARAGRSEIRQADLDDSVAYVAMGRARRSAEILEMDRRVTAWHEAGHTVAALRTPHAEPPVAVSIVPRGVAGGVTWTPGSDSQLLTRDQLRARLVVALAGRAAEEMLLDGEFTAGASSDLEQATQMARAMVDRLGMTERGLSVRGQAMSESSENEVERLLQEAFRTASALLAANRDLLEAIVSALLEHNDLGESDLQQLASTHPSR